MKKIFYLVAIVIIATSCATGYYAPHTVNQFGTQTQVVLDKANFRIVRHLEVVIDVENSNLKREDVEKSAYAELLKRANLTGSQALINVVIEEVRREHKNLFRVLFSGQPKVRQHVAARATIIEFLDEKGKPVKSENYQGTAPRDTAPVASEENYDYTPVQPKITMKRSWYNFTKRIANDINNGTVDLDFDLNNDGIVTQAELDEADKLYKQFSNQKNLTEAQKESAVRSELRKKQK